MRTSISTSAENRSPVLATRSEFVSARSHRACSHAAVGFSANVGVTVTLPDGESVEHRRQALKCPDSAV